MRKRYPCPCPVRGAKGWWRWGSSRPSGLWNWTSSSTTPTPPKTPTPGSDPPPSPPVGPCDGIRILEYHLQKGCFYSALLFCAKEAINTTSSLDQKKLRVPGRQEPIRLCGVFFLQCGGAPSQKGHGINPYHLLLLTWVTISRYPCIFVPSKEDNGGSISFTQSLVTTQQRRTVRRPDGWGAALGAAGASSIAQLRYRGGLRDGGACIASGNNRTPPPPSPISYVTEVVLVQEREDLSHKDLNFLPWSPAARRSHPPEVPPPPSLPPYPSPRAPGATNLTGLTLHLANENLGSAGALARVPGGRTCFDSSKS